jgi:hypothetical protein
MPSQRQMGKTIFLPMTLSVLFADPLRGEKGAAELQKDQEGTRGKYICVYKIFMSYRQVKGESCIGKDSSKVTYI